jgi:Domain of unknown function (DUF5666)
MGSPTPNNDDTKPDTVRNSGVAWPEPGSSPSSEWAWSQPAGSAYTTDPRSQEIPTGIAPQPLQAASLGAKFASKRLPSPGMFFIVFVLGVLVGAVAGYVGSSQSIRAVTSTALGTPAASSTPLYVVQAMDGTTITVVQIDTGQTLNVAISDSTTFKRDDWEATFRDIAIGEKVQIKGVMDNGTLQAGRIYVLDSTVEGTVGSISGPMIKLSLAENETATVATTSETRFYHFPPWRSATLAQLQFGTRIKAFVSRVPDGSYIAYEIIMP